MIGYCIHCRRFFFFGFAGYLASLWHKNIKVHIHLVQDMRWLSEACPESFMPTYLNILMIKLLVPCRSATHDMALACFSRPCIPLTKSPMMAPTLQTKDSSDLLTSKQRLARLWQVCHIFLKLNRRWLGGTQCWLQSLWFCPVLGTLLPIGLHPVANLPARGNLTSSLAFAILAALAALSLSFRLYIDLLCLPSAVSEDS